MKDKYFLENMLFAKISLQLDFTPTAGVCLSICLSMCSNAIYSLISCPIWSANTFMEVLRQGGCFKTIWSQML